MTPPSLWSQAAKLIAAGHQVAVEEGAGTASGFADESYRAEGAKIVAAEDGRTEAAESAYRSALEIAEGEDVVKSYDLLSTMLFSEGRVDESIALALDQPFGPVLVAVLVVTTGTVVLVRNY